MGVNAHNLDKKIIFAPQNYPIYESTGYYTVFIS